MNTRTASNHVFDQVKDSQPLADNTSLDASQYVLDPKINSIISEMRATTANTTLQPLELMEMGFKGAPANGRDRPPNEQQQPGNGEPVKLDMEQMQMTIRQWEKISRERGIGGDKNAPPGVSEGENEDQKRVEERHMEYSRLLSKLDLPKAPLTDDQKNVAGELLYALKGGDDPYAIDKLKEVVNKYGDNPEDLKAAAEVLNKLDPSIHLDVGDDGTITTGGGAVTIKPDGSVQVRPMNEGVGTKPRTM